MSIRTKIFATTALSITLVSTLTAANAQDYTLVPTFGETTLVTGFLPDPVLVPLLAGGAIAAGQSDAGTGTACAGFVADAPDYRVLYEAGTDFPLSFFAESSADTVLLVNAPDGSWHCNDDHTGLDPAVIFETPHSGQYDIWVGTYEAVTGDAFPPATLAVTELSDFEMDNTRSFFGMDDRIAVDGQSGPWSMIGLVTLDNASCSGTLIGPSTVLTAGHCLANGGVMTSQPLEFLAGANGQTVAARSEIVGFDIADAWLESEAEGSDFAFLYLAEPIGEQLGWMDVGPLSPQIAQQILDGTGPMVMQAGYSADQPDVLTANLACPILAIGVNNTISHRCDTLPGDSGSPLFVASGTGYRIIGVESRTDFRPGQEFDLNIAMYAHSIVAEISQITTGVSAVVGKR